MVSKYWRKNTSKKDVVASSGALSGHIPGRVGENHVNLRVACALALIQSGHPPNISLQLLRRQQTWSCFHIPA